jgi:hypothetical protein
MPPVPEGFPYRLSDGELEATLDGMMDPASWPGFDDFGRLLPGTKALLNAGLQERLRRDLASSATRHSESLTSRWWLRSPR